MGFLVGLGFELLPDSSLQPILSQALSLPDCMQGNTIGFSKLNSIFFCDLFWCLVFVSFIELPELRIRLKQIH
mgnify:CR=1 FL=1